MPADGSRICADVTSVSALAQGLNLSLKIASAWRFVAAEAMGSVGWAARAANPDVGLACVLARLITRRGR